MALLQGPSKKERPIHEAACQMAKTLLQLTAKSWQMEHRAPWSPQQQRMQS